MKTDASVSSNQRSRARTMRAAPTDAEFRLWRLLRDRRLSGFKFRRHVPVGPYIVDFLCVGANLIVEADGSQHAESPRDYVRDAYLQGQGWKVLRFWNNEVSCNREGVLETIFAHAQERQKRPSSGPLGHLLLEGEGVSPTESPDPLLSPEKVGANRAAGSLLPRGEDGAPKVRRMRANQ
jgi:very-short-patch-repair endonuclease